MTCIITHRPNAYEVLVKHDDGREEVICSTYSHGGYFPSIAMATALADRAIAAGAKLVLLDR